MKAKSNEPRRFSTPLEKSTIATSPQRVQYVKEMKHTEEEPVSKAEQIPSIPLEDTMVTKDMACEYERDGTPPSFSGSNTI